jgi:hypothetical protein
LDNIIAAVPLPTSNKKTIKAGILPTCLKTFVAPVDPEPFSLRSIPDIHFPARYPLGIDPRK